MKKLIWVLALVLLTVGLVGAAFAERETFGARRTITYTATGEADNNDTVTLSAADFNYIKGKVLLKIRTVPGTDAATPSAYTIVIKDAATGATLHTVPARSTTATEVYDVPSGAGQNIFALTAHVFVFTGLGDGNTVTAQFAY